MCFNRGMTTKVSLSNKQDKQNKLEASEPGHRTVYSAWSSSASQNTSVVDLRPETGHFKSTGCAIFLQIPQYS